MITYLNPLFSANTTAILYSHLLCGHSICYQKKEQGRLIILLKHQPKISLLSLLKNYKLWKNRGITIASEKLMYSLKVFPALKPFIRALDSLNSSLKQLRGNIDSKISLVISSTNFWQGTGSTPKMEKKLQYQKNAPLWSPLSLITVTVYHRNLKHIPSHVKSFTSLCW